MIWVIFQSTLADELRAGVIRDRTRVDNSINTVAAIDQIIDAVVTGKAGGTNEEVIAVGADDVLDAEQRVFAACDPDAVEFDDGMAGEHGDAAECLGRAGEVDADAIGRGSVDAGDRHEDAAVGVVAGVSDGIVATVTIESVVASGAIERVVVVIAEDAVVVDPADNGLEVRQGVDQTVGSNRGAGRDVLAVENGGT